MALCYLGLAPPGPSSTPFLDKLPPGVEEPFCPDGRPHLQRRALQGTRGEMIRVWGEVERQRRACRWW